jgi:hypothetical protein
MDSSLHVRVALLKIQDEISRASTTRLAKHAEQALRPSQRRPVRRGHWVARRVAPQPLRRVY